MSRGAWPHKYQFDYCTEAQLTSAEREMLYGIRLDALVRWRGAIWCVAKVDPLELREVDNE